MELNDFVKLFSEQFFETDPSVFTPETRFRDLEEWSSLMALTIIAMIDEEYGIIIGGDVMKSANTIEELFKLVASRK